jgi:insulysin
LKEALDMYLFFFYYFQRIKIILYLILILSFSQFFISPLFDDDSVDREIDAVNSENKKNFQNDDRRVNQLVKSFSRSEHAYSKFGTGNLQTLKTIPASNGICIRDELIKFHNKYYSSNIMTLCMLGPESLDILQDYVLTMFCEVKNKNFQKITYEKPFTDDSLGDITYVMPIKEIHYLEILFQLNDYREHYDSNPSRYVNDLMGHEGIGSLLSELKAKGW